MIETHCTPKRLRGVPRKPSASLLSGKSKAPSGTIVRPGNHLLNHRLRQGHFFAGEASFICTPQQISEWGMLAGHVHAFS